MSLEKPAEYIKYIIINCYYLSIWLMELHGKIILQCI